MDDDSFIIFSSSKIWYSSKDNDIKINNKAINKVRNSAKNKRIVVYEIFDNLVKNETDPYWISFFDDCAVGKLPRGFKYAPGNGALSYRVKTKNNELNLIGENPDLILNDIKSFLFEHAGIISPTDLKNKKEEDERKMLEMMENETISWSQIRSERQQSILLSLFVEKVGEYYQLSMDERKSLIQNIKICIIAGFFNADNIEICGNQITRIDGLEFDTETKEFLINKNICNKPIKFANKKFNEENTLESSSYSNDNDDNDNINQNKKSVIKYWNRYLKEINKKYKA
jgi:hypothetical protein